MVGNKKGFTIAVYIILSLLALFCLMPFLLLVISSFTEELSLTKYGYSFFPKKLSVDAYKYILFDSKGLIRGYIISILVTAVGTAANVCLSVLFAYPLSRPDLPHRQAFSFFIFFTMLFNGGLVPSYIMWTQTFRIKNTWWAYIIPGLMMSAFYVIMMRTYFTTNIPEAILEAARIDGAGEWYILNRIVLPMSVPIIATVTLLVGLSYWNDWINGLYYINKDTMYSTQALLNQMLMDTQFLISNTQGSAAMNQNIILPSNGIKMAIAVMGALPIMVIYPFFQKYFVKGITIGAVKG